MFFRKVESERGEKGEILPRLQKPPRGRMILETLSKKGQDFTLFTLFINHHSKIFLNGLSLVSKISGIFLFTFFSTSCACCVFLI